MTSTANTAQAQRLKIQVSRDDKNLQSAVLFEVVDFFSNLLVSS